MTHEQIAQGMAELALYREQAEKASVKARETFRAQESKARNDLRLYLDMLVARLVKAMSTPVAGVTETVSYQIACSATFVRAHFIINDLIMDGNLLEAATLIRKQVEVAARLNELDSEPLKNLLRRTPNVSALFKNDEGRMYGALSTAAHFGKPEMAELLSVEADPTRGLSTVSVYPNFNVHVNTCFEMQHIAALYFLGWMTGKLPDWYPSGDFTFEQELLFMSLQTAHDSGVIQLPH